MDYRGIACALRRDFRSDLVGRAVQRKHTATCNKCYSVGFNAGDMYYGPRFWDTDSWNPKLCKWCMARSLRGQYVASADDPLFVSALKSAGGFDVDICDDATWLPLRAQAARIAARAKARDAMEAELSRAIEAFEEVMQRDPLDAALAKARDVLSPDDRIMKAARKALAKADKCAAKAAAKAAKIEAQERKWEAKEAAKEAKAAAKQAARQAEWDRKAAEKEAAAAAKEAAREAKAAAKVAKEAAKAQPKARAAAPAADKKRKRADEAVKAGGQDRKRRAAAETTVRGVAVSELVGARVVVTYEEGTKKKPKRVDYPGVVLRHDEAEGLLVQSDGYPEEEAVWVSVAEGGEDEWRWEAGTKAGGPRASAKSRASASTNTSAAAKPKKAAPAPSKAKGVVKRGSKGRAAAPAAGRRATKRSRR